MDTLEVLTGPVFTHGDDIDSSVRTGAPVYDWSGGDPDLRRYLAATVVVRWYLGRQKHGDLPDPGAVIGVKGVHATVFGSNDHQIVGAASGNTDVACKERLGINFAVHANHKKFAKGIYVYGGRREGGLTQGLRGAGV